MHENMVMAPTMQIVSLEGKVLARGFWLYVWEVVAPDGAKLLYVGRTGDSSSANAQSPFVRMGQHLGFLKNSSMLRNHLEKRGLHPEDCNFREVAYGPILNEAADTATHQERRDIMAAMEKQLSDEFATAGYRVMNTVRSSKPLDALMYAGIREAFVSEFPQVGAIAAT